MVNKISRDLQGTGTIDMSVKQQRLQFSIGFCHFCVLSFLLKKKPKQKLTYK